MREEPARTPDPTIVEVRHTPGGLVALLDDGELVRFFLVRPVGLAALPGDEELVGLSVRAARELVEATTGIFLLVEGEGVPE